MMNSTPSKDSKTAEDDAAPQFDEVLKRMLASPPAPHVKKKPAAKTANKKPLGEKP